MQFYFQIFFNPIILLTIGFCFGSFVNVIIYRLPLEKSPLIASSRCPKCNVRLSWIEKIPILSWLILKGKCRLCKKNISIKYPLVEAFVGVLFVISSFSSPPIYLDQTLGLNNLYVVFGCLFSLVLVSISLIDLKHFWIPQSLINVGFLLGLINLLNASYFNQELNLSIVIKSIWASLFSYIGFEIIRLLAKSFYKKEAMGKGDSKLASLVGLWLGPLGVITSFYIAFISAAVTSILLVKSKKISLRNKIPFGPFLSFGAFIVWVFGFERFLNLISYY
tara:strand:+ start:6422 stop:7255 length:834 start_codon:yes stop_codon:yes gene_type:complete